MVLRFLAFRMTAPADYRRGDLDAFLRQAMERINTLSLQEIEELSEEFVRAMNAAATIFGENAFRKQFSGQDRRLPVNKALFESISVNLAKSSPPEIAILIERRDKVQTAFIDLMEDGRFLQTISGGTGDVVKVRDRFAAIEVLLKEVAR